jgi:hypothetical protein
MGYEMDITFCHEPPDANAAEIEARVKAIADADASAGGYQIRNDNGAISWRLLPLDRADRPKCGATCKSTRQPCRAPVALKPNGDLAARCGRHGGLSTGPQTAKGRATIGAANSKRKGTRYKIKGLPAARVAADIAAMRSQSAPAQVPADPPPIVPDVAAQLRELASRELERRAQLERDANGGQ